MDLSHGDVPGSTGRRGRRESRCAARALGLEENDVVFLWFRNGEVGCNLDTALGRVRDLFERCERDI